MHGRDQLHRGFRKEDRGRRVNWAKYHRVVKRLQDRIWDATNVIPDSPQELDAVRATAATAKARLRRLETWAQAMVLRAPVKLNKEERVENLNRDEDARNEHHWNRYYRRQGAVNERRSNE